MSAELVGDLVGIGFKKGAKKALMYLPYNGTPVRLVREPENKADRNAIRVEVESRVFLPHERDSLAADAGELPEWFALGYIQREVAAVWVRELKWHGGICVFDAQIQGTGSKRPRVEVYKGGRTIETI